MCVYEYENVCVYVNMRICMCVNRESYCIYGNNI